MDSMDAKELQLPRELQQDSLLLKEGIPAENYFQELLAALYDHRILTEEQLQKLQMNLVELLTSQTERYTNGESSSVKIEKAQSLLQAICYSIGFYLKSVPELNQRIELLRQGSLSDLFRKGVVSITQCLTNLRERLEKLQRQSLRLKNIAYQDTLFQGIPDFFHDYDTEYAPQEGGGSIDYPLCIWISDKTGIEYMETYLSRLEEENQFCSRFPEKDINALLRGYHREAEHLLFNIYELVLTNALGNALLGRIGLIISNQDRDYLQRMLGAYGEGELRDRVIASYEELCRSMGYQELLSGYGRECTIQITERLKSNLRLNRLDRIFLTLGSDAEPGSEASLTTGMFSEAFSEADFDEDRIATYTSGNRMEDSRLRELIEELNQCSVTEDKLRRIEQEVQSLEDMAELLELCFDREEYQAVYRLMNETEQRLFFHYQEQRK